MRSIKVTIVSLTLILMITTISWRTLAAEQPEIQIQIGRSDKLMSLAISPDGRYALSGSNDKTLKLWKIADGKELRTFTGHSDRFETAFQMNFEKFEQEYYDYLGQQGIEVAILVNKPI